MFKAFIVFFAVMAGPAGIPAAAYAQAVPAAYTEAVGVTRAHRFCENDIKSFVYLVFGMYDKHVPVKEFLPLLADKGLEMKFPEATLRSQADFKKWYADVGRNFESNSHTLERVDVSFPGKGRYLVDLVVFWQALGRDGKYASFRAHQVWTLEDGGKQPRILTYLVEEAAPEKTQ